MHGPSINYVGTEEIPGDVKMRYFMTSEIFKWNHRGKKPAF